jgi:hypothetical protein
MLYFSFFSFGGIAVWTQGLVLTKQTLHHLSPIGLFLSKLQTYHLTCKGHMFLKKIKAFQEDNHNTCLKRLLIFLVSSNTHIYTYSLHITFLTYVEWIWVQIVEGIKKIFQFQWRKPCTKFLELSSRPTWACWLLCDLASLV